MSILDSIIQYKKLEQNESILNQQAMTSVVDTLMKSQEISSGIDMEKKRLDVDLAKSGLRFGAEGKIETAPDLLSQLEKDVYIATEGGLENIGRVSKTARVFKAKAEREPSPMTEKQTGEQGLRKQTALNWIRGMALRPVKRGQQPYPSPKTQEEAFANMPYFGIDPNDPEVKEEIMTLPTQKKLIGRMGPMDIIKGHKRFPELPAGY